GLGPNPDGSPRTTPSARMSGPKVSPTATVPVRLTPISAPGGNVVVAADAAFGPKAPAAPAAPPSMVQVQGPILDAPGPGLHPGGPSTNEYAQAVRRRRRPMVAVAAVLAVLGAGVAYLAVKPRLAPAAGPPPEMETPVAAAPLPPPPSIPLEPAKPEDSTATAPDAAPEGPATTPPPASTSTGSAGTETAPATSGGPKTLRHPAT